MDFQKLLTSFDSLNAKKTYEDNSNEFFKVTQDKAGNGSAVIRFLPNKNVDDLPFVRLFNHGFKNEENGRWYIENSLSTIGQPDPMGEFNSEEWNTGLEEKKEEVRKRKRKLSYISNILVIKDPANPDNNGKVFKFKYGKKLMEKIMAAAKPNLDINPDAEPINAYDPHEGANFSVVIAKVAGYPNYDQSQFGSKAALFKGDQKKIDEVLANCYDINEEIAPSKFKSYDELKKKMEWVLGTAAPAAKQRAAKEYDEHLDSLVDDTPPPSATKKVVKTPVIAEDDDDDALFKSLLSDD